MDLKFYTAFVQVGNKVHVRGYGKGSEPVFDTFEINPDLFTTIASEYPTEFKTLNGDDLYRIPFNNVWDRKNFLKEQDEQTYYGPSRLDYSTVSECFSKGIILTPQESAKIRVAYIDIEVESENGFAKPENPVERVNAVTIIYNQKAYTWALGKHTPDKDTIFIECESETQLFSYIKKFFMEYQPDIISGWYCEIFDIPYLIARSKVLFGDDKWAKALSPFNMISEQEFTSYGDKTKIYEICGITILDYHDLYLQYGKKQPSYTLNAVCKDELGESKVPYEGSLKDFYHKDFDRFVGYNVQDTSLVCKLEKKLHYIQLAQMLAYKSMVRYKDVFMQVRMWEMRIYHELTHRYKIMPHVKKTAEMSGEQFEGAYVGEPIPGMYRNVITFDVAGLYPSLIMLLNISPETFMGKIPCTVDAFLNNTQPVEDARNNNCALATNGALFKLDKPGFIPIMLDEIGKERSEVKKKLFEVEKRIEAAKVAKNLSDDEMATLEDLKLMYDIVQYSLKISANSCYGAIGSSAFMFFNRDMAEAVTISGKYTVVNVSQNLENYLRGILKDPKARLWLYSDTDSTILSVDSLVKKLMPDVTDMAVIERFMDQLGNTKLKQVIEDTFEKQRIAHNAPKQRLSMKREYICDRVILVKAKNYALHVLNKEGGVHLVNPEIKIKGLEAVKSSTPNICRKRIKECMNLMFTANESDVIDFIAKFRAEFEQLPVEEIGCPIGANGFKDYYDPRTNQMKKGIPIQLRASIVFNNLIKSMAIDHIYPLIAEGEKIKYVYMELPNSARSDVLAFKDIWPREFAQLKKDIDYDKQFDRTFLKPTKRLLDVIGWKSEHVDTLDELFA